jgi:hypothetical protein
MSEEGTEEERRELTYPELYTVMREAVVRASSTQSEYGVV